MPAKRRRHSMLVRIPLLVVWAFAATAVHAGTPVLAKLQYTTGGKIKSTPIPDKPGKFKSPVAGKPQLAWVLAIGDTRTGATPPVDRAIRLYHYVDAQPVLLCTVLVKYFPHDGKWQPNYRMEDNIVLMRDGEQLKPIPSGTGDIEMVLTLGSSLPNGDGYYSRLEFGIPSKPVSIDAYDLN